MNHQRVERLMRENGIVGVHKPAKVRTTIPSEDADRYRTSSAAGSTHASPMSPGSVTSPKSPTGEGWLYLAMVLDLGSRRVLGYSMADHMRIELVADALTMAAGARGGVTAGIIFHGDRGSQLRFKESTASSS